MELFRLAIVSACTGCGRIDGLGCSIWAAPFAKQRMVGGCASQTNRMATATVVNGKVRVGQQKQKAKAKK
jgi:hypothetical protein